MPTSRLVALVLVTTAVAACGGGSGGPAAPSATPTPAPSVGPVGGTVSGGSGRLVVPAGALAQPVAVTVGGTAAVPLDPYAVIGASVEVGPAGTVFATPATLVLRYASAQPPLGIDPRELRAHVLEAGAWRLLPGGGVDTATGEVSAPIGGAGVYGVLWVVGPSVACGGAAARQFDFWLGAWNLVVPNGVAGTNDITRVGCVLEEEFHEVSGTVGRSVSFLSNADRQWYQTYIDSRGNRVPLRGVLEGQDMVLYHESGAGRSTWQPQGPDRVHFFQEAASGASWRTTFDSFYERR